MSLFRDPGAPRPPTFAEAMARANAGLPKGARVVFRPGRDRFRPYRVLLGGADVGGAASLEAAIFRAMRLHKERTR